MHLTPTKTADRPSAAVTRGINIPWPVLVIVAAADLALGMWLYAEAVPHLPGWAEAVLGPGWGERIEAWTAPGYGRERLAETARWVSPSAG